MTRADDTEWITHGRGNICPECGYMRQDVEQGIGGLRVPADLMFDHHAALADDRRKRFWDRVLLVIAMATASAIFYIGIFWLRW